ncbi:Fic family protein [Microbacterium resistens]|uniref:Fic family protein n=1 Tax=Microbacterium resistens TaxID=156977 RepID=A0ABU1SAB2_9MICO|nr:Fic family protein [Microbacterium resistens]MDR6866551.1 Fic family protein [Microbacterium resistens]
MSTSASQWPALGWEDRVWQPAAGFGRGRYKASVPPLIATLAPAPSAEATEAAAFATNELSRFDAELGHRVAAFAPVLLRSESASSSQIENLTASARAIFSAELGAKGSRNAELIASNTQALRAALELSSDISPEAIREMHRVLMARQPRHTPGEWRDEPVWIGTRTDSPIGAEFVAPDHDRVPVLISDLTAFADRRDLPSLTSVAVAHAQFETIHPFSDGNGRTGRAIAQAMLRHRGVTRNVAVPVSAGLLADVDGYHRALTDYRAGDVSPIVMAFASASMRAISNARQLIADIDQIQASWTARLAVRRSSNAWRLLDVIARRPVLDAAAAADELGVQRPNVYPPLEALVGAGILTAKAEHRLGPFWRSAEILDAIDAFAKRAGRREMPR